MTFFPASPLYNTIRFLLLEFKTTAVRITSELRVCAIRVRPVLFKGERFRYKDISDCSRLYSHAWSFEWGSGGGHFTVTICRCFLCWILGKRERESKAYECANASRSSMNAPPWRTFSNGRAGRSHFLSTKLHPVLPGRLLDILTCLGVATSRYRVRP